MKSARAQITEILRDAKKSGKPCAKVQVGEAGYGQYNCSFSAPYEIRCDGVAILTISDKWSSPYSLNCWQYFSFAHFGHQAQNPYEAEDYICCLFSRLPKNAQKWIESLPEVDEAEQMAIEL